MVDGEALDPEDDVETPKDDGETGNNTCCRSVISISNMSNLLE